MCAIAGLVANHPSEDLRRSVSVMADSLRHRGPDGQSVWVGEGIGLGHCRLAIVDLSLSGAQPMSDSTGRFTITFNGEIYNYLELREQLTKSGKQLRSTSDTEAIVELFAEEGESVLEKLRGMFAFAIWDSKERKLFFARDRIGKKPFFYREDIGFAFASELRALIQPGDGIDWDAVRLFFGLQYVSSPRTGFQAIKSLPPGYSGWLVNGQVRIKQYSSFERLPKYGVSFTDASREVRRLLDESVRLRMIADVDVGTFLSGGIDSSAIACLMAKHSKQPIQTFTMGFPSFGHDERGEAEKLVKHLGSNHHAFEAKALDALACVDTVLDAYGAPFADSSAIPTYLLARETRAHVKAVMSGDGGDELFGGYRRYKYFENALRLQRLGLGGLVRSSVGLLDRVNSDPRYARFGAVLNGLRKGIGQGYGELFTGAYFNTFDARVLFKSEFLRETEAHDATAFIASQYVAELGLEGALDFDLRSYLPDDLNVKMDRASMAHGLEARAPFLDQELVSYVSRLPAAYTIKAKTQKALLKEAVRDCVPPDIFTRPKRGFQVPLAEWFRGPLRSAFVERCLSSDLLIVQVCQPEVMRRLLEENDRGRDHGNRLWMLMSLSTWLEKYV